MYVEFQGKQLDEKEIIAAAKKIWVENGNKSSELKSLKLYIKPEENQAYYVFNDEVFGSFPLD
jgi:hypothetical protein